MKSSTWKAILIIGAIVFCIAMVFAGFVVPAAALIILLIALGGGALLSRKAGPPA